MTESVIALNRFGLGARPGESDLRAPRQWLADQLDAFDPSPAALRNAPSRELLTGEIFDYRAEISELTRQRRERRRGERTSSEGNVDAQLMDTRRMANRSGRARHRELINARVRMALTTSTPFAERLVHFWTNHFAISVNGPELLRLGGLMEFDAIRPNVMGRFHDMLLAVTRDPAMLLYLNQARSIGPNSPFTQRGRGRRRREMGLNENLAREIMELHTLGVDGGYSQADVTEFARALTGWTIAGLVRAVPDRMFDTSVQPGGFGFAESLHEPGARRLMGRTYAQSGRAQAEAILADLAAHPSTARHLATKLARHFAGDEPPAALIDRLASAYRNSGGDLPAMYRVLIDAEECWVEAPLKFKTPWEWTISTFRALGERGAGQLTRRFVNEMGQPTWRPGSPAGFDDVADSWTGAAALASRVEIAQRVAEVSRDRIDARTLAPQLLGTMLSSRTARIIAGAESADQGLALLLVSPEFLRR
ncbi:DUF1800 domain-containing protein [Parasphingopyxis sp.]|uniref:DUF1800 domain-containing protein n=1 Tax=Parasphingopyxis sp. TaxID=1920299 RepID=UPI00260D82D4|nr:DUF1800 domain-containing protein [Parasphingopyxis sp.]